MTKEQVKELLCSDGDLPWCWRHTSCLAFQSLGQGYSQKPGFFLKPRTTPPR